MTSALSPLWSLVVSFLALPNHRASPLEIYELLENVCKENGQRQLFYSKLSPSQLNSFRIIEEWWAAAFEEEEWYLEHSRSDRLKLLENYAVVENASPIVVQILYGIQPPFPRISTYQLHIHRLFQMEFDPKESESSDFDGFLQSWRQTSAFYSCVQRMLFAFENETSSGRGPIVDNNNTDRQQITESISASIEPCPWLRLRKSADGLPYFLWDTELYETIEVEKLATAPAYVCISHTWGRWKDEKNPPITVPGVPWLVPQNTLYNVNDLPAQLKAAGLGRFVWFDLFCIPQDRSLRAAKEISRQAEIFGNAETVICWLNNIESWAGLESVVRLMAEFCARGYDSEETELSPWKEGLSTGLVLPDPEKDPNLSHMPSGWFTSLWTLQEACLRPDMLLCNRNFEFLRMGRFVFGLDSLIALLNFTVGFYTLGPYETISNALPMSDAFAAGTSYEFAQLNPPNSKRYRRILPQIPEDQQGLLELNDAIIRSGMSDLYHMSPMGVLHIGQYRVCKLNRAEAIMSVTGATSWYKMYVEKHGAAPPQDDLILGVYPQAFVEEVVAKFGGQFYFSVSNHVGHLESLVDFSNDKWEAKGVWEAVGSMLPFRGDQGYVRSMDFRPTKHQDHESISCWEISQAGIVKLNQVGILSSSDRPYDSKLPARIYVPFIATDLTSEIDLHKWIKEFRPGAYRANVAISLFEGAGRHCGVILKQIGAANAFVKIGSFIIAHSTAVDELKSESTDWIVF